MIDILFDQYQRYNNVANIINSMRVDGESFSILEVGANEHQNLEKFLPDDQITYLDIQLPENLQNNPKYKLGDATAMEFIDNEYNIVVALDVFEHIAEADRVKFISEIHRVSSEFFVITAPFDSIKVVEAERRANAVYKSIFNKDFIWLEEHMVNGLPKLDRLTEYLDSKDINHLILNHGDLNIWETMMTIHFVAAQNSRLGIYRNEIDRYYNQYIFNNDFVEDSYRKICIGSKQRELSSLEIAEVDQVVKTQQLERLKELENKFYILAGLNISEESNAPKDFLQIFKDEGEGYTESDSIKIELENNTQHIDVKLDSGRIKSLRIDPSNYRGTFEIKNLRLTNSLQDFSGEEYLMSGNYNWRSEDTFVFYNDDPYMIFHILTEMPVKRISFDILPLTKDEAIVSVIDHLNNKVTEIERHANETQVLLENDILTLKEDFARLDKINSDLENTKKELTHTIDISQNNIGILQKKNEEMQLELLRLQQENDTYGKELNSIYTSRGWIYLTKVKKLFGK